MAVDLHYYKGDCTTLQAQRQTKHNFIQMIKGSPLWQSCQDPELGNRCTTDNTKVTCARVPAVNGRKKRSSGKLLLGHVCTWKVLFLRSNKKRYIWGRGKTFKLYIYIPIVNCNFKRLLWTSRNIKQKPTEDSSFKRYHASKRGMVLHAGAIIIKSGIRVGNKSVF